jgi:hypothetical protein
MKLSSTTRPMPAVPGARPAAMLPWMARPMEAARAIAACGGDNVQARPSSAGAGRALPSRPLRRRGRRSRAARAKLGGNSRAARWIGLVEHVQRRAVQPVDRPRRCQCPAPLTAAVKARPAAGGSIELGALMGW